MPSLLTALEPSPSARGSDAFTVAVDRCDAASWSRICGEFADANLYQTWAYESVRSGEANVSHLLLKRGSAVVAAVQARIVKVPFLRLGVAYVLWGPLWKPRGGPPDPEVFRLALRALRNEHVGRRKLLLRLAPRLYMGDDEPCQSILAEEGFLPQVRKTPRRTILMDITPPLEDLHRGLHQKWRYHLNKARKQNLDLVEGEADDLFQAFELIYTEMLQRKQFDSSLNPAQYRAIQKQLAPEDKMRVFLCRAEGEVCAGGICSTLGETGIYLYGATSNRGTKTYGSYLVHWRMLEWVKQRGCRSYDLNGINPDENPGGYQFKTQLAGAYGRDVQCFRQFDAYPNKALKWLASIGDRARASFRQRH